MRIATIRDPAERLILPELDFREDFSGCFLNLFKREENN
jgi:hypothetical protein